MDYEMESAISGVRSEIADISYAVEQAKREAWQDLNAVADEIRNGLSNLAERVSILESQVNA